MTSTSTEGAKTILHPVSDLEKSKPIYAALLGGPPQADAAYYVGFDVPVSTSAWCRAAGRRA